MGHGANTAAIFLPALSGTVGETCSARLRWRSHKGPLRLGRGPGLKQRCRPAQQEAAMGRLLALLVLVACLFGARACRFAESFAWAHEVAQEEKLVHRRALQQAGAGKLDTTNLLPTLVNSSLWLEADKNSLTQYAMRTLPITIADATTPVNGEKVDHKYRMETIKQRDAADVPGAARYLLRSAPEMIAAAAQVKWQDFLNVVELQTLDPVYQTIFKVGYFVLQPQFTGPLYVRLAFHDAATWNKNSTTNKGGANGSIRYEFDWPSNGGLQRFAYPLVWAAKQVVDKLLPSPVSWADMFAISGAVGLYKLHGPLVNVGYGRPDVEVPDDFGGVGSNTNDQRDYPADQLIAEWESYGFTPYDLCTLSGGHAFGLSASTNPQGYLTPENRVFGNKYYQNILLGNAFFQSDRALGNNPLTRPCVEAYAADNQMFFRNFTRAYQLLTWLGVDSSLPRLGLGPIEEYHG
ncbi:hypothetical protein WJX81_007884 [Elliptochloris bilobata]|uniref:L-ascorbate peroxidase n=1 Tax=Elliptochloris bilobata TaxID=381761 RepID=A0AAW1REU5_9CHLO